MGVKRRRLRRVVESSSSSGSGSNSSSGGVDSSSECELELGGGANEVGGDDDIPRSNGGRVYEDYIKRIVIVPSSYFGEEIVADYRGVCKQWGKYSNYMGDRVYGYYVHYDDGDRYWMLEKDVHKYVQ